MLYKEIVPVFAESDTRFIIQNAQLLIAKAGGTYSYHWALKS
jgi:hypothetical protein